MKPIQTGIATALALAVIAAFFIFPGLSPFGSAAATDQEAATTTSFDQTTTNPTDTTTMPPTASNPEAQGPVTKLQVTDTVVGTGAVAAPGDMVTVNYVGALTDGKVFDASANNGTQGFTFPLGAKKVIQGWDEGVAGMKVGGKRHLVIPASLGYGSEANGPIPANSTLIFDVELLNVKKGQ